MGTEHQSIMVITKLPHHALAESLIASWDAGYITIPHFYTDVFRNANVKWPHDGRWQLFEILQGNWGCKNLGELTIKLSRFSQYLVWDNPHIVRGFSDDYLEHIAKIILGENRGHLREIFPILGLEMGEYTFQQIRAAKALTSDYQTLAKFLWSNQIAMRK